MSTRRGIYITLGIAASAFVLLLLFLFNPTEVILVPKCSFHELTGLNCPGCGMQRFLHALMHGHFSEAIHYNYAGLTTIYSSSSCPTLFSSLLKSCC